MTYFKWNVSSFTYYLYQRKSILNKNPKNIIYKNDLTLQNAIAYHARKAKKRLQSLDLLYTVRID